MMPQNEVVYLCPGEQHSIVCSTNQTRLMHIIWIIDIPHYGFIEVSVNVSSHACG